MNKIHLLILTLATLAFGGISAQCSGKVDLGAAYVHMDTLTSGHTTHSADLAAIRAEVSVKLFKGLVIKPVALYGASSPFKTNSEDSLFASAITIGHCIPVPFCEKLILQPNVGWTYARSKTIFNGTFIQVDPLLGEVNFNFHGIKQTFNSNGPLVGVDAYYAFTDRFRASVGFAYSWSRTHSEVHGAFNSKSDSKGAAWSGMLEYDLNACWSVNVAGTYNNSLSHEKHGLRIAGAKLGIARWF